MKHYKDNQNNLYGFTKEQNHLVPSNLIEITAQEAERIGLENYEKSVGKGFESVDYYRNRLYHYPEIGEFLDAWVKNDQEALEKYRQKCLEVKTKFPKPEGF